MKTVSYVPCLVLLAQLTHAATPSYYSAVDRDCHRACISLVQDTKVVELNPKVFAQVDSCLPAGTEPTTLVTVWSAPDQATVLFTEDRKPEDVNPGDRIPVDQKSKSLPPAEVAGFLEQRLCPTPMRNLEPDSAPHTEDLAAKTQTGVDFNRGDSQPTDRELATHSIAIGSASIGLAALFSGGGYLAYRRSASRAPHGASELSDNVADFSEDREGELNSGVASDVRSSASSVELEDGRGSSTPSREASPSGGGKITEVSLQMF